MELQLVVDAIASAVGRDEAADRLRRGAEEPVVSVPG
jgi:hypothetical protein